MLLPPSLGQGLELGLSDPASILPRVSVASALGAAQTLENVLDFRYLRVCLD